MKKIVFLALLLTAAAARAQLRIPKPVWGVKAGLNNAYVKNVEELGSARTDFCLGVFAEWALGPFAVSPELLYSREGGRSSDFVYIGDNTFAQNAREVRLRVSYLQFPLAFKYYIGNASLDLGIQYGHLLGSGISVQGYREEDAAYIRRRVGRASLNTSLFSTFIGTGIVYDHLAFTFRILYGQTPVFRDDPARAMNYQVGLAWAF